MKGGRGWDKGRWERDKGRGKGIRGEEKRRKRGGKEEKRGEADKMTKRRRWKKRRADGRENHNTLWMG